MTIYGYRYDVRWYTAQLPLRQVYYVGQGQASDIYCPKVSKSSERLLATSSSLQTKTSTSRFFLTATAVAFPTANQGGNIPHG